MQQSEIDRLKEFATTRQAEYLDAFIASGTYSGAAKQCGASREVVRRSLLGLKKRAVLQGYSPEHDMTRTVPDGFRVRGVSSLYDKDGKLAAQWVKSSADDERRAEIMQAAFDAMAE